MILYGKQVFTYALEKHPEQIETVYLVKEIDPKLFGKIRERKIPVERVDPKKAQGLAKGGNHQGFLARLKEEPFPPFPTLGKCSRIIVLDGVTDVGNIGAIIRTAYALGMDGMILSGAQSYAADGVVRTSSGAALDFPVDLRPNIQDVANDLKTSGFTLVGAVLEGDPDYRPAPGEKIALFLGSESQGLTPRLVRKLDVKTTIAMRRPFDSLNVGAAAAILIDRMTI